jgi:hypothetical protein
MSFKGSVEIPTREHKGDNDKTPPNWKRLDPASIRAA